MPVPVILPTGVQNENYAGVTYHIEGELVPVLQIELQMHSVYFEHYILLWKEPNVEIGVKQMKGAFKRVMAGMPIFLTQASGSGRIAFSRDGAGHVIAMHLAPGEGLDVREHQFLAATDNVEYGFSRVKGAANMLFGGTGFFVDSFDCRNTSGILWLHGYGNVFEITLGPGEQIDIEPGGWVYKDRSVQMNTQRQNLKSGLFASAGSLVWNRFVGPGRVGLQSM
ncbi:MAG TPA: AIM24 family protein, partial [Nitrolancea sp.]|nr:AIM24 family protein [Nitrolancea sp.]